MLPDIYEMDDYSSCMENNNLYCKVEARMTNFKNDTFKQQLLNLSQNINLFDRSVLKRSLCISKPLEYHENYIKEQSENLINQRIKDYEITTTVFYIKCTDGRISISLYDYFILFILLAYTLFVIFATFNEIRNRSHKNTTRFQRIMSEFSIIYNWKRKTSVNKNVNFQKLLSMQGLRFFTTFFIVLFHTTGVFLFVYISNPEDFEKLMETPPAIYTNIFNMYLVMNFFVLSSCLLAIQVNGVVKKFDYFSIKHIGIILLNRYFRLITTAGFVILLLSTSWAVKVASGPLNFDLVQLTHEMCRKNFFYDLLFLQNFLDSWNMCNPLSWYIACDFQLYVINLMLLYIWYKYKFKAVKFFSIVMTMSLVVYAGFLYVHNSNGIFMATIRTLQQIVVGPTTPFLFDATYRSPYSVFPGSLVGLILGMVYITNKDKEIKYNSVLSKLCNLFFFGLPCLAFVLNKLEFQRLPAAVLGSMTKPLYSLGIAIGIFGMSHKLGGKVQKFYENKYVVLLGNFSYCTYICHWLLMIGLHSVTPPFVDVTLMVTDMFRLLTRAMILGVIISLTVEEPGLSIQKRLLPQISSYEKHGEKKK